MKLTFNPNQKPENAMQKSRGFTLVELLVVIAIIALLIGLLLPALAKARASARTTKDASQMNQVHKAMLIYANSDKDNELPIPGKSFPNWYELSGNTYYGRFGSERAGVNNSHNLYSLCIAQEYFKPAILIGPTEVNDIVVRDDNYDYDMYQPVQRTYWDPAFSAAINGSPSTDADLSSWGGGTRPEDECNASYAHLALHANDSSGHANLRRTRYWVNYARSGVPVFSTRGTSNGNDSDENRYSRSPTLRLHGPERSWEGNCVFADSHTVYKKSFYASDYHCQGNGGMVPDNMFTYDMEGCSGSGFPKGYEADAWNGMCNKAMGTSSSIGSIMVTDDLE